MSDDGVGLMSYSHLCEKIVAYNRQKMAEDSIELANKWLASPKALLWKSKPKRIPKNGKESYPYKITIRRRLYWKLWKKCLFKDSVETTEIDLSNSSGKGLPIMTKF
jgi:hypothetical protein